MTVSLWRGARTGRPFASAPLREFILAARGVGVEGWREHAELVARIRQTADEGLRHEAKARLASATPSARFAGRRRQSAPWTHSGAVCVDIDKTRTIGAAQAIREQARRIPECVGAFVSPSARGVKVFLAVDPLPKTAEEHRDACATAMACAAEHLGGGVDPSCLDVTRLVYASVDHGAWQREPAARVKWEPGAAADRPRRVGCGRLSVGNALDGALPGDMRFGRLFVASGQSPETFHRLLPGGRHLGLIRGVQRDALLGIDRREEWIEAACGSMGMSRRREIVSAADWAHAAGVRFRRGGLESPEPPGR